MLNAQAKAKSISSFSKKYQLPKIYYTLQQPNNNLERYFNENQYHKQHHPKHELGTFDNADYHQMENQRDESSQQENNNEAQQFEERHQRQLPSVKEQCTVISTQGLDQDSQNMDNQNLQVENLNQVEDQIEDEKDWSLVENQQQKYYFIEPTQDMEQEYSNNIFNIIKSNNYCQHQVHNSQESDKQFQEIYRNEIVVGNISDTRQISIDSNEYTNYDDSEYHGSDQYQYSLSDQQENHLEEEETQLI